MAVLYAKFERCDGAVLFSLAKAIGSTPEELTRLEKGKVAMIRADALGREMFKACDYLQSVWPEGSC